MLPILSSLFLAGSHGNGYATVKAWVPLFDFVEQADLVVVGTLEGIEKEAVFLRAPRVARAKEGSAGREDLEVSYNQGRIIVSDVLMSKRPYYVPFEETLEDGTPIRYVHLAFRAPTRFHTHALGLDDISAGRTGVWLLKNSPLLVSAYTALGDGVLPLDSLQLAKRCVEVLARGYGRYEPGIPRSSTRWVRSLGGTGVAGMACDAGGGVVVAGYSGVAKYDSTGRLAWTRKVTSWNSQLRDIACNGDGMIAITGRFNRTFSLGGENLTNAGTTDCFVATITPSGGPRWVGRIGNRGFAMGSDVVIAEDGSVVVAGFFTGDLDHTGSFLVRNAGMDDAFLARFGPTGQLDWLRGIGGPGDDQAGFLLIDDTGHIVLVGSFNQELGLDGKSVKSGDTDIFVARVQPGGETDWLVSIEQHGFDVPCAAALDNDGGLVVAMKFYGDGPMPAPWTRIVGLNQRGQVEWSFTGGGEDITVDEHGDILTTGYYGRRPPSRRDIPLAPMGDDDLFVAKYNRQGERLWVYRDGGVSADRGLDIETGPNGDILVLGTFRNTGYIGGQELRSSAAEDGFVLRFAEPAAPATR